MAQEMNSTKIFGGAALPAGTYNIHSAFCDTDSLIVNDRVKNFETLEVRVFNEQNEVLRSTLRLNGCWRARKGSDGKPYQASGTFFDGLLKHCTGTTFSETRDYINNNLAGFQIILDYTQYPSTTGFGNIAICNISNDRKAVPALPADWKPLRAKPQPAAAPANAQPANAQPAQPQGDLPF
jgi:hypothetical protein